MSIQEQSSNESTRRQMERARKRENWERTIEAWKRSGLSQVAFCKVEGIKYDTFVYWRVKFLKQTQEREKESKKPALVPIKVKRQEDLTVHSQDNQSIQVLLPMSIRLSVPPRFDRESLSDLLSLLGFTRC